MEWLLILNPFISVFIGMVIGWFSRMVYEVHRTSQKIEVMETDLHEIKGAVVTQDNIDTTEQRPENKPEPKSEQHWYTFLVPTTFADFGQIVVILAVILSIAGYYDLSNQRAHDQNISTARIVCENSLMGQTLEALNERNEFTNEINDAQIALFNTQGDTLELILDPNATPEDFTTRIEAYAAATRAYVKLQNDALEQRETFPYPTEQQFEQCGRNAREQVEGN